VRQKLQLKAERRREGCAIAVAEEAKLARLLEKYGIESEPVNSVDSAGGTDAPTGGEQPPII
jgi:hypothetical protein